MWSPLQLLNSVSAPKICAGENWRWTAHWPPDLLSSPLHTVLLLIYNLNVSVEYHYQDLVGNGL